MNESTESSPKPRWSRSQRFELSTAGRDAHAAYVEMISASRAASGRDAMEAGHATWASQLSLQASDGLYLSELLAKPLTLEELATAVDGCGPSRADVKKAVERLVRLRIMDLVIPPPPPPPPMRRW